jgi:hypothetical protein
MPTPQRSDVGEQHGELCGSGDELPAESGPVQLTIDATAKADPSILKIKPMLR